MNIDQMCELKFIAQNEGVIFFYSGYFSQKVLLAVGDTIKHKMSADDVDSNTSKKIFTVFVEQVQNIIRYSTERIEENEKKDAENELSYGLVVVGKEEESGRFYISCGNMILKNDVVRLKENLEEIQHMDKDGLKKAYKEKLKAGPDEHSKGAGIGFLEIARKASKPIRFDFRDASESNSLFFLHAYI